MKDVVSLEVKEVFDFLQTSSRGLSSEEARLRLEKYGPNTLVEKKQIPLAYKFLTHLRDLFSVLLLFASVLAVVGGMLGLSLVILALVLVNTLFSLFQEWRAEKAMETLKSWMPQYAKVIRDGELKKIFVKDVVPGDLLVIEEGDRVPADARLCEAYGLWTNNVPLTGESEPQPRNDQPAEFVDESYIDAPNLVFMSTSVAKGGGRAVVFATGMNTKFGQIAGLTLQIEDEQSPLQKEIAYTAKIDFISAISVGMIFFLLSFLWLHLTVFSSILFMIGVMVACVPEGLQVTVSSALAINVVKMAKENVLVKRLSSVQTLGSVTIICTDKTGTITKGEMTATKVWVANKVIDISGVGYAPVGDFTVNRNPLEESEAQNLEKLLEISALCNSAKIEPPNDRNKLWSTIGDPTDGALLVAATKYGLNMQSLLAQKPLIRVIPFNSTTKWMGTIHQNGDMKLVYIKGATRSILFMCNRILVNGKTEELTDQNVRMIETRIREFATTGLRVIAIAYNEMSREEDFEAGDINQTMIFVGLVAMKDPPRPEVRQAVRLAKQAGIETVIITGDYGPTAEAIASEVDIVNPDESRIVRGVDLETKTDEEIVKEVKKGNIIFARVSPEQKLRIVKVLKEHGEIVAVTGDGANDAPSLREADIGISMGLSGASARARNHAGKPPRYKGEIIQQSNLSAILVSRVNYCRRRNVRLPLHMDGWRMAFGNVTAAI